MISYLHNGVPICGVKAKNIRRAERRQGELYEHGRYDYVQDEVLHVELK